MKDIFGTEIFFDISFKMLPADFVITLHSVGKSVPRGYVKLPLCNTWCAKKVHVNFF